MGESKLGAGGERQLEPLPNVPAPYAQTLQVFYPPLPPCRLPPLSISQQAAAKGMDDFLAPPSPPAHPFRLHPPSSEEAPAAAEMQDNKPAAAARISFSLQQIPTAIIHPIEKKREKNPNPPPCQPSPPPPPYIGLAGRLLVPAVGPGPGFGAMLQLLAGGRQVHKGSGGGGDRLRGGERAARRLSILCGGRACRRRGGAE